MDTTLPTIAGTVSTVVFVGSVLPMLHKAVRTRELSSYSFGNIALANLGNAVHSVYVFALPPGPIWVLHTFYLVSSALMLFWYVRCRPADPGASALHRHDVRVRRVGWPGRRTRRGRAGHGQSPQVRYSRAGSVVAL